jgi:hypothetical protein
MRTKKDIIAYNLFRYIAQRAGYLAIENGIPAPSVRRILAELVAEGRATVGKDIFGFHGYLATKPARQARRA